MLEKDPYYGCRLDGPDAFIDYGEIARKEIEEILKLNPGLDTRERRPIVLPPWMTKDNQEEHIVMDLTELKKKSALDVLEIINRYLDAIYPRQSVAKYDCYVSQGGDFFKPFLFDGAAYSFGIEYASNETEASKGIFEDGDLFYLEDYDSLDDMIEAMRREIEE